MPPKRRRSVVRDGDEGQAAAAPAPAHPFDCPICFEPCVLPVTALCGVHTFCRACLVRHVSDKAFPLCPCCRKPVQRRGSDKFDVHTGIQEAIRQRADADKYALAVRCGFSPSAAATLDRLPTKSPYHAAWAKLSGLGVPYDLPGAVSLLRTATATGHKPSIALLAYLYYVGIGVKVDTEESTTLWRDAAVNRGRVAGDAFAIAVLAEPNKAKQPLLALAEEGHAAAAVVFSAWFRDDPNRDRLLRMAAAQGDVCAMYESGLMRFMESSDTSSERDRAVALVEAAASAGFANAQDWFGRHLFHKKHPDAVAWLKKSATQGCTAGIIQLGYCYLYGQGVAQDRELAIHWLESAVRDGCGSAHELLGLMWEKGLAGSPVDYAEAMRRYKLASDFGTAGARVGVGRLLEKGLGVPVDTPAALRAYRSAEAAGDSEGRIQAARLSAVLAIRRLGAAFKVPRNEEGHEGAVTLQAVRKELAAELVAAGFEEPHVAVDEEEGDEEDEEEYDDEEDEDDVDDEEDNEDAEDSDAFTW